MTHHRAFAVLLCWALTGLSRSVDAGLMTGQQTVSSRADQSVLIPEGSPLIFEPVISAGAVFDLSALGSFTVGWEADTDNDGSTNVTSFSASFFEAHPVLGRYDLLGPGVGPGAGFAGQLDDIVESNGALVSATLTIDTTFSLSLRDIPAPPLYTQDRSRFVGILRGPGGPVGDVFTSLGDINVFLSLGDPATDPLAAVSFDRTVTTVPEPSTAWIFITTAFGAARLRLRKRRQRA